MSLEYVTVKRSTNTQTLFNYFLLSTTLSLPPHKIAHSTHEYMYFDLLFAKTKLP